LQTLALQTVEIFFIAVCLPFSATEAHFKRDAQNSFEPIAIIDCLCSQRLVAKAKKRTDADIQITDHRNVDKMTKNVNKMTGNGDTMTKNVDKMTENVDTITKNVDKMTKNVDKLTENVNKMTKNDGFI
jgi:hypothetical protein